jgi:class 3 adenylate cyclase/tetratricopeptide (TPR) repeat protein
VSPAAAARRERPAAERRLVSVLFADLVGFTSISESRDAEEVRELLSNYFDVCKRLISLYGGTVEKFIGDAVMAVWGTPMAQEDDAERAVRTALDLVAAVPELDPALKARAGVLTGEAAVTLAAQGEGMVAGDLVNTASRVQAAAEAGTVLTGEATKRATEAAIAYADAGSFELKGKAEAVPLFRALRVTAGRAGALKSEGLEPPFVGRERELRLVKELFHASAAEGKAHLVTVSGIAGIGKSRLAWEFFKYLDGISELTAFWHRGRCLAYGEGVAYWALAEMVRMRARIVEGEEAHSAREKLRTALAEQVADPEERSWIEPRLAHLLGLEERQASEREDLFAAWRLFVERLAGVNPTVLVFEDMQWADASLLDFVDYLLEWSRQHPIFVLCLARPELQEHHPDFGKVSRNATTLSLEPLSPKAMEALLEGFVPGLPETLRAQIFGRAEGVPLYAVETVRMLLDRGLLVQEGASYRPTGEIEQLEVPETLHALVAARLDGLASEERRLLQEASVLGKTFTKEALSTASGLSEPELDPLLSSLVRKEFLSLQADPRSPERGQYGFLQDLVRRVAYETLSKRERKTLHLAAATHLETSRGPTELEIVEVVASHYLAAYQVAPEADDAIEMKAKACAHLARAGERAASLAANEEAQRYFEQAAALAGEPVLQARLLERAGDTAFQAEGGESAQSHFAQALQLFEDTGEGHEAARVTARLGVVEWRLGLLEEALERMERAFSDLQGEEPDADVAALAAELGRLHAFRGEFELASERLETALELAESLWLPEVLAQALTSKGLIATFHSRYEEGLSLTRGALALALEYELPAAALRAFNNVGDLLNRRDRFEEAVANYEQGLAYARRVGARNFERTLLGELSWSLVCSGRWQEALACLEQVPEGTLAETLGGFLLSLPELFVARGDIEEARRILSLHARFADSADLQERASYRAAQAVILHGEGRSREALEAAEEALAAITQLGAAGEQVKIAFPAALEGALALGECDRAEKLLEQVETLPPGRLSPVLRAQAARFRARMAAADGEGGEAETRFAAASSTFREFGLPFWLAVTLTEHGEWLAEHSRDAEAEPLFSEAREAFQRLEAWPWAARLDAAQAGMRTHIPA